MQQLEFLLRLVRTDEKIFEITFRCTKRQIDKVIHSIAFAAYSSTLRFVRLYLVVRAPNTTIIKYLPVDKIDVQSDFYRLVYCSEKSRSDNSNFDPSHLECYKNV